MRPIIDKAQGLPGFGPKAFQLQARFGIELQHKVLQLVTRRPARARRAGSPRPATPAAGPRIPRAQDHRRMIDLNAATAEDLDAIEPLRGHGFEIVRYREERGRFTSLRELNEVPGLAGKADGVEAFLAV